MGSDKCLLPVPFGTRGNPDESSEVFPAEEPKSWAVHQSELLRSICDEVYLSLHSDQISAYQDILIKTFFFAGVIPDADPKELWFLPEAEAGRRGPAAALFSAHLAWPDSDWLVLAGDMIHMDRMTLEQLAEVYRTNQNYSFYAYRSESGTEPLAAIYRAEGLSEILSLLKNGESEYSGPSRWLKGEKALILKAPLKACFANMNSPADLL